jgi:hypothetical protein
VRFRVQFLDRSANVVSEMQSSALSIAYVIDLLKTIDWPLVAVGLRILDRDGCEVYFLGNIAAEAGSARFRPLASRSVP